MSGWIIAQIILNIIFVAAALVCWARLNRPQKDDPRLSKGLQLLQSKIAILEDLSDRTDLQVKQLASLLEQKGKEVQEGIIDAQAHLHKIERSIERSLDVSKIFQERIPHEEIVERQNTRKYVQAAKLAHQGMSVEDIEEKIDLPRSELEFIVKVNRNKLMFAEEQLPDWASDEDEQGSATEEDPTVQPRNLSAVFEAPRVSAETEEDDKKIKEEFRKAIEEAKARDAARESSLTNVVAESVTETVSEGLQSAKSKLNNLADKVLKPHFIEGDEDLKIDVKAAKPEPVKIEDTIKEVIETKDAIKEAASLAAQAKKRRLIVKNDDTSARALKPVVFKKLKEDRSI